MISSLTLIVLHDVAILLLLVGNRTESLNIQVKRVPAVKIINVARSILSEHFSINIFFLNSNFYSFLISGSLCTCMYTPTET